MPNKAMLIGMAQPLANTGMERQPVITAIAISPVTASLEIVTKHGFDWVSWV